MRAVSVFVVAAALSLAQRSALAQPEGDFETRVDDCPPDLSERLPAVVRLEVMVLVRERHVAGPFIQWIAVRCEGDTARIDAAVAGAIRSSIVDSHAIAPEHRARVLGLSAAELVDAMWNEAQKKSARPVSTAPEVSRPAEVVQTASRPDRPPSFAIGIGGVVERVGRPATLALGGRLGIALGIGPFFTSVLSLDATSGDAPTDAATVGVLSLCAGAHLLVGRALGRLSWGVGPGMHAGWVRLDGKPSAESGLEGRSFSASWAGAALRGRLAWSLGSGGGLAPFTALEGDAGLVLVPVRGMQDANRRVFSLDGPWLTVALSAGISL
jgi:hypothetical protein